MANSKGNKNACPSKKAASAARRKRRKHGSSVITVNPKSQYRKTSYIQ